jgi:death-on-curing protein
LRYLTVEEVAQINADLTGAALLRDAGLLASAVGRPAQTVFGNDAYHDLYTKVAALFESLACNHAFTDGNKRTAVVAAIHMLNWNGYDFIASDTEVVDVAVATAQHQVDLPKLAEFFRRYSVPLDYGDESDEPN